MNTLTHKQPLSEISEAWQSMVEAANATMRILSKLGEDILKNQSDAGADWISETARRSTVPHSPQDVADSLWHVPSLYEAQSRRLVDAALASASVMSRGQQELLEWAGQVYSDNIQRTAQAMTGAFGALASRRVSAEIINFSDRRVQKSSGSAFESAPDSRAHPAPAAESSAAAKDKSNHRANRQAAA